MCNLFIMEHYPLNEMKCVDISKTTISLRRAKSVIFASNLIPLDFAPPWMMHNLASHVKRIAHIAWIRNTDCIMCGDWLRGVVNVDTGYRSPFTQYQNAFSPQCSPCISKVLARRTCLRIKSFLVGDHFRHFRLV